MTEISAAPTRAFAVRVEYFSADDRFAVEDFTIEVAEGEDAMALARARSDDSIYFNERVPDLRRAIAIAPVDDDPAPPPAGGGAVKPLCPRCGGDEIVRDACVAWDGQAQDWSLVGVYDSETCTLCDAEGNCMSDWVPLATPSAIETFASSLAAHIGDPGLSGHPDFVQFCRGAFRDQDLAAAAARWLSRAPTS